MTEKYYNPKIEEFHVGFEYERNDGAQWAKKTSDIYDLMDVHTMLNKQKLGELAKDCETYEDFVEKTGTILPKGLTLKSIKLNPNMYSEKIRVKHLDQEDIESLGFTINEDRKPFIDGMLEFYIDDINYDNLTLSKYYTNKLHLEFNYLKSIICIHNGGNYEDSDGVTLFCNNKSELKRILKQIGV